MNENFIAILIVLVYFSPVFYQLIIVIRESKKGNNIPLKKLLKFLKYSFLILLPLAIVFGVLSHTNFLNYEKPLSYDKYDEITFKNFRGLEFFKKSLYGSEYFAYVVVTIDSEIEDDFIEVQALFHPSRSYVYNSHSNSVELLTHEKYHFKITELFARRAREELSKLNSFSSDKINAIVDQARSDERSFQKEYDYDTFHSYVYSEQKKYQKEVDSLLSLLSEFKNSKISIDDKD